MDDSQYERLRTLRRDLHRHPEPAWREFYTTARLVEELEPTADELVVGPDFLDADDRLSVPEETTLSEWRERALDAGADPETVEHLEDGQTGLMAVLERGEGPTVGLRVDIDGLPREESDDPDHEPVAEGFRSETGAMHACGHDAHAAIGVGVFEAIADSDFTGTLKVLFQPAEEIIGGAKAVSHRHLDDIDALLAVHIGLDHPTGEIVAGVTDFLAVSQFHAEFTGEPAHAGGHPAQGENAVQAMAAAVQNLYAIPRNEDGPTRINAGVVEGGTASNIIPEHASIEGEVRGETTELMTYMRERVNDVIEHAAGMHGCEYAVERTGEAPSATNDEELVSLGYEVAEGIPGVDSRLRTASLGGSEDATVLMRRVQETGGTAAYVGVGTDHPGGHHTATFDVDEPSLAIGVDWLSETVCEIAEEDD
ncbi:amidohydrolase [Halomicrobium mukohataei]|uniref:Amidohydrolase n=1 Tax=Halomicrobium mukohataei TaxID=57705 RepID=A0A847UD69_9EURY|nr:amidohydrolase [Halomicrobium mukohataei]NLV11425.1 amidohydrolase [Halomicrobium mukohataei]